LEKGWGPDCNEEAALLKSVAEIKRPVYPAGLILVDENARRLRHVGLQTASEHREKMGVYPGVGVPAARIAHEDIPLVGQRLLPQSYHPVMP
jgi:hypothetical protein